MGGAVRFGIVIACTGIAFARARRSAIRTYFGAQVANAALGWLAFSLWGVGSRWYAGVYVVAELLVLAAMLPLIHGATYYCEWRTGAFLLAAIVGLAAAKFSIHGEPRGLFDWIGLVDTGIVTAMATATAIGAAYLTGTQKKLARAMMVFWLALASFHFSAARNLYNEAWSRLNDWLPAAIVSICCLWIARIDGLRDARG